MSMPGTDRTAESLSTHAGSATPAPNARRRWARTSLLGAGALALAATAVFVACTNQKGSEGAKDAASAPASASPGDETVTGRWEIVGTGQNSLSVGEQLTTGYVDGRYVEPSQLRAMTYGGISRDITGHPAPAAEPSNGGATKLGEGEWATRDALSDLENKARDTANGVAGIQLSKIPATPAVRAAVAAQQAAAAQSLRGLAHFPGSLPAVDEEIWVIQKYKPTNAPAPASDDTPGTGSLIAGIIDPANVQTRVPVPLQHTAVDATITGNVASVSVNQQFANPFASKIEAVYVFPLPENAAVSEFVMTVGDRKIRGIIRDREEAKQIYESAKAQGHVASLLQQERPNIFTQKVANIEPGKNIGINITYFSTLAFVDGEFEFVFPMVVGPRFNPAGTYDGVGAVSREAAAQGNTSGQATEVAYLKPSERSGHDIAINVKIDAGMPIERVYSNSHVVDAAIEPPLWWGRSEQGDGRRPPRPTTGNKATVALSSRDSLPNKDFVLRYRVAGDSVRSGVVTHVDKDGTGYFSAMVVPPADPANINRAPVELVFVLDCSGSMNGRPMEQSVAAVTRGLRRLQPHDTFQIINFASGTSQLGAAPVAATDANIAQGIEYVKSLGAQGGTYMVPGLRAALDFPHDPRRHRFVCFLTDGFIGNEAEIVGELHGRLGASRVFSFGVGTSTNRYLLDAMAKVGRGCVAHVAAGDSPDQIMDRFFDRISRPALTDVKLDLGELAGSVEEVFPRTIPDLYAGRAIVINGKLKPGATLPNGVIRLRGTQLGQKGAAGGAPGNDAPGAAETVIELPLTMSGIVPAATHSALPQVWARHKLADIADHANPAAVAESVGLIRETALRYGLMSAFTSFVAVDSQTVTAGTSGTTVTQPVPMPEGVRYETNVSGPR